MKNSCIFAQDYYYNMTQSKRIIIEIGRELGFHKRSGGIHLRLRGTKESLRSDVASVGRDMKLVLKQYGKENPA